jgi:hypothetical protein
MILKITFALPISSICTAVEEKTSWDFQETKS